MRRALLSAFGACLFVAISGAGSGQDRARPPATPAEMRAGAAWIRAHLTHPARGARDLPFSFVYHGRPSADLLGSWRHTVSATTLDRNRKQRTDRWLDPESGLEVRCVSVTYGDFPAVEWTTYLKNTGRTKTPIIEGIQGLDTVLRAGADGEFALHGIKGDWCTAESYEPYRIALKSGAVERFAPAQSGKSCDGARGWPYFNLQTPEGGAMIAIGWPGQWAASFAKGEGAEVRMVAGQERTHMALGPGEEVRAPLIALVFWRGADIARAQNLWRRWYMAHVIPKVHGQPQTPVAQIQVDGDVTNTGYVQSFLDAGIKADICWRDAGGSATWYPSAGGPYKGSDAWLNTGTWEVDPQRIPRGFRPYSDWVHAHGMAFLLWFEPERVGDPGSWLGRNHPEWMLPGTSHGALLNLGDSAALQWLIDHIDGMIRSQGLDWYREDMNGGGPLPAWRRNDAEDRQGTTENHYVQGHLAFWDALRQRNPGLRIDSCASGGRRNDLETMRRAVPLLRSDFQFPDMPEVVIGNQCQTYGLSAWLPFQGTGCYQYDIYSLRSFYLPGFGMGGLSRENVAMQRRAYAECARIAPLMLGDYYPLTAYSRQADRWIAWQFDRPEQGDGAVQAFRRDRCDAAVQSVRLRGLDPAALYEITNHDEIGVARMSGRELMETGLTITLNGRPAAALLTYQRVGAARAPGR